MMKYTLTIAMIFLAFCGFSQDDDEGDGNLAPNGDFESVQTKTLKNYGMLQELCDDWYNGTQAKADIFSTGLKSDKVSVPNNDFGMQEAASGERYAGFRAYTKDKKKTRSYLSVKLTEELEKNQMYCVQFKISMADLSKYSVNNIGVVLSDRKIYQPNTGSVIKDIDVKDRSNKVLKSMDAWETVCATFTANGGEEYLVLGCFEADAKLKIEKNKRPRNVTGAQTYEAYYYVDDVSVVPVEAKSQCNCSSATQSQPDLIYGSAVVISPDMSDEDILGVSAVYFPSLKKSVNQAGVNTLNKVIEMMKANPDWKL
ncbi:MAG: hypothetical protein HRT74_12975 [Flavobacteriales bacterium]|nr:hypothetical protein [Flavobacteriales bacterium]